MATAATQHRYIAPTHRLIPGTPVFTGEAAQHGYALNAMCYSFNSAENRATFRADEEGYCRKFHLTPEQHDAVAQRDVLAMLRAGGNIYYLAKLAGIFGLNVQDLGAQQTGLGVELLNWIAARGALDTDVREVTRNYHIPISNTAAATLLLETRALAAA